MNRIKFAGKILFLTGFLLGSIFNAFAQTSGEGLPKEVKWMYDDAQWGISHHFLAGGTLNNAYYMITDYEQWDHYISNFDVKSYAKRAKKMGVGFVMFTITQNRGYLCTTSKIWDEHAPPCPSAKRSPGSKNQLGTNRADYTPSRDLIGDLAKALKKEGIKTIVYIPYHVCDRWTGEQVRPSQYPDWYVVDFLSDLAQRWGKNVAGWWFDGLWEIRKSEQANDFPVLTKIYNSIKSGNPDAVMGCNYGITNFGPNTSYVTHDKFAHFTGGEYNTLPQIPTNRVVKGYNSKKVQYFGWTYTSKDHPVFAGWGQIKLNLKFPDKKIADHTLKARAGGGVSAWDVAINMDGTWPLDRLKQIQTVGLATGTTKGDSYASLSLINDNDKSIDYNGEWETAQNTGTGAYKQDIHRTTRNGDSYSYSFAGKSIVLATSIAPDQGDVEIFIDGKSQGVFSTNDPYRKQIQTIIFEKHNLKNKKHTLKVVKISGKYMVADLIGVK
ncbi:hypothetical protein EMN47_17295 [Prolixibacteraceae bacterium JC049]|nr:hypothetical protein [Prolixibacteraceae bacterium JC049]